ncbi:Trx7/PDZ domain-containing (seleno)protein [Thalassoroseus pseudoceratinae]|uniref:Trx7/PDZ domain-containing (seleno)protein n=1 Tax=Thalassoroseus pseudoceratinae TaxID=2713176 RepID=UPI0014229980|nr:Trx7/PDZ domain-containing (seleno)protein [Thalassoroseus pseudoceratinae]
MKHPLILSICCVFGSLVGFVDAADNPAKLKDAIKDTHATGEDWWVYNDLTKAREIARRENKPLFVTFRCVPCKDCEAFDAEVAAGNEQVEELARTAFIPVRQVEMKGVDLSQFQFDYDLNWAAMFINADGTVYARYGTQSAAGADAYNSLVGLKTTMRRVLELHKNYPANRDELVGKLGEKKPYKTALEMPGLPQKERYRGETARNNCIHCHNIHDAEHFHAISTGQYSHEMLWRWPLPDQLGIEIDAKDGRKIGKVIADSPAAKAGLKEGESITHMDGQAITSIADMQWVLHNKPNKDTKVAIQTTDDNETVVSLKAGWKKNDISWRGSLYSLPPRLNVWLPEVAGAKKRRLRLADDVVPLEARWINKSRDGGKKAFAAGLRVGDVITEIEGEPNKRSPLEFQVWLKLNRKPGDILPITVLRNGKKKEIRIPLVE